LLKIKCKVLGFNIAIGTSHLKDGSIAIVERLLGASREVNATVHDLQSYLDFQVDVFLELKRLKSA
jgi:hypothetical protein